jgi:hypothetical protein
MDTWPVEKRATEAYYVTPTENNWPEKQKEEWLAPHSTITPPTWSLFTKRILATTQFLP